MSMSYSPREPYTRREVAGAPWLLFSAVIMITGGFMRILDALWAFDKDDEIGPLQTVLFDDNLTAWGWIWMAVGVLLVAAGFGVLAGSEWARWFGIFVAAFSAVTAITWIYAYPIGSLVAILIAIAVIYGLTVYGGKEA